VLQHIQAHARTSMGYRSVFTSSSRSISYRSPSALILDTAHKLIRAKIATDWLDQ
jgi:hypothetical protein